MAKQQVQEPQALERPAPPGPLEKPVWMESGNEGLEQIDFRDMKLPRLILCQKGSPQKDRQNATFIKGLEEGMFFNSLSKEIYGEFIQVVPLFFYKSRIMFRDMKEGGGIICQAPDGKSCQMNHGGPCLHAAWGPSGEPPECNEFFNYPCIIYRGPGAASKEWIVVSMKTTGLDAGRTLNSYMRLRGTNAYGGVYKLSSRFVPEEPSYYTWQTDNGTPAFVDQDLYNYAKGLCKPLQDGLKAGTVTVDDSDAAFASHDEVSSEV